MRPCSSTKACRCSWCSSCARDDLANKKAAILGMGFKAESDDKRDSLSYKLKKLLSVEALEVLCTDPYVPDG